MFVFLVSAKTKRLVGKGMHVLALVRNAMPCANHHGEKSICMFLPKWANHWDKCCLEGGKDLGGSGSGQSRQLTCICTMRQKACVTATAQLVPWAKTATVFDDNAMQHNLFWCSWCCLASQQKGRHHASGTNSHASQGPWTLTHSAPENLVW